MGPQSLAYCVGFHTNCKYPNTSVEQNCPKYVDKVKKIFVEEYHVIKIPFHRFKLTEMLISYPNKRPFKFFVIFFEGG